MKALPPHLLAMVAKRVARHREMCALFSPREIDVYTALLEKRVNAQIARLKAQVTRLDQLRAEIEKRKFALRRLAEHERARLSTHMLTNYCRPETLPDGSTIVNWPPLGLLPRITEGVVNYLEFTEVRVKRPRPLWKAFTLLDKRIPSLQLASQLDELARRALDRLREDSSLARDARPLILCLWCIDHPTARQLMKFDPAAQSAVKKFKEHITRAKAQAKREAARDRKRRQRALPDSCDAASR